ncbi:hypothetical protein D3C72_1827930 [compost metagenome]
MNEHSWECEVRENANSLWFKEKRPDLLNRMYSGLLSAAGDLAASCAFAEPKVDGDSPEASHDRAD